MGSKYDNRSCNSKDLSRGISGGAKVTCGSDSPGGELGSDGCSEDNNPGGGPDSGGCSGDSDSGASQSTIDAAFCRRASSALPDSIDARIASSRSVVISWS